jgi:hypothetical protein
MMYMNNVCRYTKDRSMYMNVCVCMGGMDAVFMQSCVYSQ